MLELMDAQHAHANDDQVNISDVDLSVIIVNYNTRHLLEPCFNALEAASVNLNIQYCIVDNASGDGSVDELRACYPANPLIINDENVGFGRANNQCISSINAEFVLLLNTDAFVSEDTLKKTLEYMASTPECGVLGVKLIGRDGVLQPSCRYFPTPWNLFLQKTGLHPFFTNTRLMDDMEWDHASCRECDWVPGCYYLVRRSVIDEVGLFDSRYFLYYEEVDHCFAVKKSGWKVHFYPHTEVVHIGGESAKSEGEITDSGRQIDVLQIESEMLYFRKNYGPGTVLLNNCLQTIADLLIPTKRLLKMKYPFQYLKGFRRIKTTWSLFFATKFATQATR
jgi:N-acetylglucosaminyl-diphospho-decaprenol L-rhamnosyltransferase